jgi:hypothetical protein
MAWYLIEIKTYDGRWYKGVKNSGFTDSYDFYFKMRQAAWNALGKDNIKSFEFDKVKTVHPAVFKAQSGQNSNAKIIIFNPETPDSRA